MALRPNDATGVTINPSSYSAAQQAAVILETRQGDNELIGLGLVAAPAGNRDLTFLANYAATAATTRY